MAVSSTFHVVASGSFCSSYDAAFFLDVTQPELVEETAQDRCVHMNVLNCPELSSRWSKNLPKLNRVYISVSLKAELSPNLSDLQPNFAVGDQKLL